MQHNNPIQPAAAALALPSQPAKSRIRAWLSSPRGLIIGGVVIVAAGLALGWNWVVALGFAPFILAAAPCAAMCALGMCMMPGGKSGSATPIAAEQIEPPEQE